MASEPPAGPAQTHHQARPTTPTEATDAAPKAKAKGKAKSKAKGKAKAKSKSKATPPNGKSDAADGKGAVKRPAAAMEPDEDGDDEENEDEDSGQDALPEFAELEL